MADKIVLSPTMINRWVRCRKSYHWRYNEHLVRLTKSAPLSLGIIVSEIMGAYYGKSSEIRDQKIIDDQIEMSIEKNRPLALGDDPKPKVVESWNKVEKILPRLLSNYHERAKAKDDFNIVQVETRQRVELTPKISLQAIPDAIVEWSEDLLMVLEHKVRGRYRQGDFGIDYQSIGSCMVSGSMGTLYNILQYNQLKYYREVVMRSEYELEFFRRIFTDIGNEILTTPPERMYPMPMKKCYCDYWELCVGEMQGVDLDDIISSFYRDTHAKKEAADGQGKSGREDRATS